MASGCGCASRVPEDGRCRALVTCPWERAGGLATEAWLASAPHMNFSPRRSFFVTSRSLAMASLQDDRSFLVLAGVSYARLSGGAVEPPWKLLASPGHTAGF